jgi:hypothetical protein
MPSQAMIQGVVYRPALLAAAQVRLLDRKFGVDTEITRAALVDSVIAAALSAGTSFIRDPRSTKWKPCPPQVRVLERLTPH